MNAPRCLSPKVYPCGIHLSHLWYTRVVYTSHTLWYTRGVHLSPTLWYTRGVHLSDTLWYTRVVYTSQTPCGIPGWYIRFLVHPVVYPGGIYASFPVTPCGIPGWYIRLSTPPGYTTVVHPVHTTRVYHRYTPCGISWAL